MDFVKRIFNKKPGKRVDILIALLLFGLATIVGMRYIPLFIAAGGKPGFGQREFGAAVMWVCGKGFVNPGPSRVLTREDDLPPALSEFLFLKKDSFSCAELPATLPPTEPNLTQSLYRYLMLAAAFFWLVSAISWSNLFPLFGLLFGLTITLAYGIFRLGMGRLLAVIGSLALTVSSVHLSNLPHLRDYAKAPFMLALILLLGWLVTWPLKRATLLGLSIAYGLVLGIGFGFRNDLLLTVFPFAVTLFFFTPGKILGNITLKIQAFILFLAAFVIMAWPIISAYGSGSNTGHVILLGLMSPFDAPLGVTGSLYQLGNLYLDYYAGAVIEGYAYRIDRQSVDYLSAEYDRAAIHYLLEAAKTFPADILIRAYGSILKILEMPFAVYLYSTEPPPGLTNNVITNFYTWRIGILQFLSGSAVLWAGLTLIILSARSLRLSIFLALFLIYFAGSPAIQFHVRHFFYWEFISWWALGFVLQQAVYLVRWLIQLDKSQLSQVFTNLNRYGLPSITRIAGFIVGLAIIILVPLLVLRQYQQRQVSILLDSYISADKEAVSLTPISIGDDGILFQPSELVSSVAPKTETLAEYLVAEFTPSTCNALQLPVTFRYKGFSQRDDFSETVTANLSLETNEATWLFFPAYFRPQTSRFIGVELAQQQATCLNKLYRVKNLEKFPLLLNLTLFPGWKQANYYQTLTQWENNQYRAEQLHIYTLPTDLPVTRELLTFPLKHLEPDITFQANAVQIMPAGQLFIKGEADQPFSYLLQMQGTHLTKGSYFIAQGELYEGGFTLGLLKNDQWAEQINVTTQGKFAVVLEVPADDRYALILANYLPGGSLKNSFVINTSGWVEATSQ